MINPDASPVNVLGNGEFVWFFQTLLGLWKGLGWSTIIYLSALSGIDEAIYEAAKIDGAGRLRCVLHITFLLFAYLFFKQPR